MKRLSVLLAACAFLLLMLALCSVDPGPVQSQEPLPEWVTVQPAQDCATGCWRLVDAYYLPQEESAGLHHAFGRTRAAQGGYIVAPFGLGWPDGSATTNTKTPPDWGDHALWSCFFPDQGEVGAYRVWAGAWEANSDTVHGLGLPYCHHVTYWLTWQWDPAGGPTATPTPTVTASATPVPPAHWLYLPVVEK